MSYNLHTEVPSGATSRGYEYETQEDAIEAFERVRQQLKEMQFVGRLILSDSGTEVQQETFNYVT